MDYMNQYKYHLTEEQAKLVNDHSWIVCLCGSTRFKELFMQMNREFTKQGAIVLMPGVWGHSGDTITDKEKEKLDKLHRQKNMMADIVYIVNPDHYIGESTKKEIEFAKSLDKIIYYFDGGSEK